MIHVCSLARLHPTVEATGARHVVTLLRDIHLVSRPSTIALDNHLVLAMDDISVPLEGYSAPADEHVSELVKFLRGWDRRAAPVLHCYAGLSPSTAGGLLGGGGRHPPPPPAGGAPGGSGGAPPPPPPPPPPGRAP